MSFETGTYLGAVRCLESLHGRCVMDKETDCWHLRKADGKPMPRDGKRHHIWIFGHGPMTATRGAWLIAHGTLPPQRGMVVYRSCDSYDCVNPKHLKSGLRKAFTAKRMASGQMDSPARRAAVEKFKASCPFVTKVTAELKVWLIESTQNGPDVAHGLGISPGRANVLRKEAQRRPRSVFELRA